jgi:endoglucanase
MNRRRFLTGAAALSACGPARGGGPAAAFPMRRGVNLGNALEAPTEGDWGYRIAEPHLGTIAAAGFDGVRLPVRWDAHADADGRVHDGFLARVREVVAWALAAGLRVQLDAHHYDELITEPARERARFLALWDNIARAFADAPDTLSFELLNEPHGPRWTPAFLKHLQSEALGVIRRTNPTWLVVLGGGDWQSLPGLLEWTPPSAPHIAASVHSYEPWNFTHQGAPWLGEKAPRFGRAWGTEADHARIGRDAARAAAWARRHGLALQLGEFGVNAAVPLAQRAAWTRAVRGAFESQGIAWCVWDFAGAFPIFDLARNDWIAPLRAALFD